MSSNISNFRKARIHSRLLTAGTCFVESKQSSLSTGVPAEGYWRAVILRRDVIYFLLICWWNLSVTERGYQTGGDRIQQSGRSGPPIGQGRKVQQPRYRRYQSENGRLDDRRCNPFANARSAQASRSAYKVMVQRSGKNICTLGLVNYDEAHSDPKCLVTE